MLTLSETNRLFWICFIFALMFVILGVINFLKNFNSHFAFLGCIWLLQMFLILLFAYYGIIYYPGCMVLIFIIYFVTLLFSMLWAVELHGNLMFSNLSLVVGLILTIALIFLSPPKIQVLGILSVLIWLFLFYYVNFSSRSRCQ